MTQTYKITKAGQPDLIIDEDCVSEHESLGWTVVGRADPTIPADEDADAKPSRAARPDAALEAPQAQ